MYVQEPVSNVETVNVIGDKAATLIGIAWVHSAEADEACSAIRGVLSSAILQSITACAENGNVSGEVIR